MSALTGAILGDICGSQYEFSKLRPKDLDWKNVPLFTDKCRRTDDSILSIATKDAIHGAEREGSEYPNFTLFYHRYGNAYHAGYGGMFNHWLSDSNPKPYNSFGNGSAMRCSYIGEHYDNAEDVVKYAKMSAAVTHNHPEGIKGAVVTAACVAMAKRGDSKDTIYKYVSRFYNDEDKYRYPITMPLNEMRKIYKWDVTCQGSVPAAIRCFLESDSWEGFMRNVMSLPCDMDTLGAIGGGIAAEFYKETIPNEDVILQRYLEPELYNVVRY